MKEQSIGVSDTAGWDIMLSTQYLAKCLPNVHMCLLFSAVAYSLCTLKVSYPVTTKYT